MRAPVRWLAALLVLGALLASQAAAGEPTTTPPKAGEVWFALYLDDAKAGYAYQRETPLTGEGPEAWRTDIRAHIVIARMGQTMQVDQEQVVVEDAEGRVLRFSNETRMGPSTMRTEGRVEGDTMHLVINDMERQEPYPGEAIGPAALARRIVAAGFAPGTTLELPTFFVDQPAVAARTTVRVEEVEEVDVFGRTLPLHRARLVTDVHPIPLLLWFDAKGEPWATEMTIPFGRVRTLRTEEAVARMEGEPAEVFLATLIEPDRPIAKPRALRRAVYRIRDDRGPIADFYEGEGQRIVERGEDGSLLLAVQPARRVDAATTFTRPFEAGAARVEGAATYLGATPALECDDEAVRAMALEAVGEATSAGQAARRIERYVRRVITNKGFDVGFATAAEVARSRSGDCSEHAVLAAALARVVGLPSRVVTGVVYVETGDMPDLPGNGAFGWHMWTEVLVAPDAWLAIDAAIGMMDATHIAIAKSPLRDGMPGIETMLPLLERMGGMRIEVVEASATAERGAGADDEADTKGDDEPAPEEGEDAEPAPEEPMPETTADAVAQIDAFIAKQSIDKSRSDWKVRLPKPPRATFEGERTYTWVLETAQGTMRIRLMPDVAPMHVSSTIYLTRLGFYDALSFHRVIPGFMAQGGCPLGTGTGGPGYAYDGEFDRKARHDGPGILSMANAGPGTDGSQFFLTFGPTPHLDDKHTVFGRMVEGEGVLRKVEGLGTSSGKPRQEIRIEKATIEVE